MIHVAMPALNSSLVNLGLSDELIERVKLTIGMLTLDPLVCSFHVPLEEQLMLLIENSELQLQGLATLDEVIDVAKALSQLLTEVAARYNARNVPHRAELVLELSLAIQHSLKWA